MARTEGPAVDVSVLATFDEGTIYDCIRSVMALDHAGPLTVQIREQGGNDAQHDLIQRAVAEAPPNPARTVVVTRGENVGFAVGHNLAMRAGTADFVLLVNADADLDPGFLAAALPHFDDPQVGAIQGKLTRPSEQAGGAPDIDTLGFTVDRKRRFLPRGMGEADLGQYDEVVEVFGADGAVPLYRRRALDDVAVPRMTPPDPDQLEYFDESFFIYKEDVDLAWRLSARGWRTLYVPAATASHVRTLRRGVGGGAVSVMAQRRKNPPRAKYLSFSNHRVMQVKNERVGRLARDLVPWLSLELAQWGAVLVTERMGVKTLVRFVRMTPLALKKRRWTTRHRPATGDPYRWFR
jgi:GT2 family glycosyltransferase